VHTKELNFVVIATALVLGTAISQSYGQNEKCRAKLDGDNEVPPVNSTADGMINFKSKDGSMSWKMNMTGITDPTGAHIHKAKNGTNGIWDICPSFNERQVIKKPVTMNTLINMITNSTL
jgi:CHRD domain